MSSPKRAAKRRDQTRGEAAAKPRPCRPPRRQASAKSVRRRVGRAKRLAAAIERGIADGKLDC